MRRLFFGRNAKEEKAPSGKDECCSRFAVEQILLRRYQTRALRHVLEVSVNHMMQRAFQVHYTRCIHVTRLTVRFER